MCTVKLQYIPIRSDTSYIGIPARYAFGMLKKATKIRPLPCDKWTNATKTPQQIRMDVKKLVQALCEDATPSNGHLWNEILSTTSSHSYTTHLQ